MINNVKFSVTVPTYSATHKRNIMGTTPVLENIVGRYADLQSTMMSEIVKGQDGDRPILYRLIFQRDHAMETIITSGAIITITHRLHVKSRAWRTLDTPEQYIVQTDHEVNIAGSDINLGLIRKDQQ